MPLSVEEFKRGRDFTAARINELEEDGKGGRGVEVRNSKKKTCHSAEKPELQLCLRPISAHCDVGKLCVPSRLAIK